jgi:flagellar basal body-associated protein FliL
MKKLLRGRMKVVVPLLLVLVAGAVYMTMLSGSTTEAKRKVAGDVYVLPKDFVVNLSDGHFAKLTVALVLAPGALPAAGPEAAPAPVEGFGALPQEAVVRDVVTDEITGVSSARLTAADGRRWLKRRLLAAIRDHTDVRVLGVLLPDVAVQ